MNYALARKLVVLFSALLIDGKAENSEQNVCQNVAILKRFFEDQLMLNTDYESTPSFVDGKIRLSNLRPGKWQRCPSPTPLYV